jgi:hypothetical protein
MALALISGVAGILACLAACSPAYDWRDVRGPGGEYRVHLPAKPAEMTRRIHLEDEAVEMTMQGARVGENAFTVAVTTLPASMPPEHVLVAMREQMLRNIGAPASTPVSDASVDLVDAAGRKVGVLPVQAVDARGTGPQATMRMRARFMRWHDHALQIVAIGPDMEPEQADHFLASLRLVAK